MVEVFFVGAALVATAFFVVVAGAFLAGALALALVYWLYEIELLNQSC